MSNKVCYIGFPDVLIVEMVSNYLDDIWDLNSFTAGKSQLFFFLGNHNSSDTAMYLNENNIPYLNYNLDNLDSFKQIIGFKNAVIWNTFDMINQYQDNYFMEFVHICNILLKNNAQVYYCNSDIIFQPQPEKYVNTDRANTQCTNRNVLALRYFDEFVFFLREVKGYKINRIIIPEILDYKKYTITSVKRNRRYYYRENYPKRCHISYRDLAICFQKFQSELKKRNYMFSTDFYASEPEMLNKQGLIETLQKYQIGEPIWLQEDIHIKTRPHSFSNSRYDLK